MVRVMMGRIVRAFAFVSLPFAPAAQAQQADALQAISNLIDEANQEIFAMQAAIDDVEGRLAEWGATLQRVAPAGRITVSSAASDADFGGLADVIADHPMVQLADPVCRDYFQAVAVRSFAITDRFLEGRLTACADALRPSAKQPSDLECANLTWVMGANGALRLEGYVQGSDDLARLQDRFGLTLTASVVERPEPVCTALSALEVPMTSNDKPRVSLLSEAAEVAIDGSLAFQVTTPGFYSFVYVVYLQADGSIVNLMPRRALLRQQHPPRTQLFFGDGQEGRQTYTASHPIGTEAIVAVTAASPIEVLEDLESGAAGQYPASLAGGRPLDHSAFLDLLGLSVDDLAEKGRGTREISAEVLHVTIVN